MKKTTLSLIAAASTSLLHAQTPVPGFGTLVHELDFENDSTGNDLFDYSAGWAGRGFGLSGSQRGAPENIYVAAPPAGGVSGSTKALYFERENRATSTFYTDNPEVLSASNTQNPNYYASADGENQDDFFIYYGGAQYTPANRISVIGRYYVDLTKTARSSFGLRTPGEFTNGSQQATVFPAVWTYTDQGSSGRYDDLRVYCRVPNFATGSNKEDIFMDLPDTPGWWTLGIAYSTDGDIHYYASPGVDELSADDYLTSASREVPGHSLVNLQSSIIMISTSNDDTSNSIQIMDDIQLFTDTTEVVNPEIGLSIDNITRTVAPNSTESFNFEVDNTNNGELRYEISDNASWLTLGPPANGDFEQGTNNGGGSADAVTGWTFTDILSAGDHSSQGYYSSGSFTSEPASDNGWFHLGRSSQISQTTSITMVEGATYRVRANLKRVASSFAMGQVAFTDGTGADLTFSPAHSYTASAGTTNGGSFSVVDTVNPVIYDASFTATASDAGKSLGIRIASVRDSGSSFLGVDDVQITQALPQNSAGMLQTATINTNGLSAGTYNGTITVSDSNGRATSKTIAVTLNVNTSPSLALSTNSINQAIDQGSNATVSFSINNTGDTTLNLKSSSDAEWLSVAPPINGNFERGTNNGGGALDSIPGWTFQDIGTAGDHSSQGYLPSGSFTASPATYNGFINLGRSSQIIQNTGIVLTEGVTYKLTAKAKRIAASYALGQIAFTDATTGSDLTLDAAQNYSTSHGVTNGGTFGSVDANVTVDYVASFTATAADAGKTLGLRLASIRDEGSAFLGVDDITLTQTLPVGAAAASQQAILSAEGLASGTYTGTITVSDDSVNGAADRTIAVTLTVNTNPSLALSTSSIIQAVNSGNSTSASFTINNTGDTSLNLKSTSNAEWLSVAPPVNGNFERGSNNGGGSLDSIPGWTFQDIGTAGDHNSQGYAASGSFTATPATNNGFINLGRSSQITQNTGIILAEGVTYHLTAKAKRISSSYAIGEIAFTDATTGSDLTLDAAQNYSASHGVTNGGAIFSTDAAITIEYEATFTATAADAGKTLGLRIASVRDSGSSFLGVDDVTLTQTLPVGASALSQQVILSAEGLASGTYTGTITVSDDTINGAADKTISVTLVVGLGGDTDNDNIGDAWELEHAGDLTSSDPAADDDNDGLNTLLEYILDSDPTVPNSMPQITSLDIGANVDVKLPATSARRSYTLMYTSDLSSWTPLGDAVLGNSGELLISQPHPNGAKGFFKIEISVPTP